MLRYITNGQSILQWQSEKIYLCLQCEGTWRSRGSVSGIELKSCNGQFCVSWLGYSIKHQLFDQLLMWVLLWSYVVDVSNVYNQLPLSKKDINYLVSLIQSGQNWGFFLLGRRHSTCGLQRWHMSTNFQPAVPEGLSCRYWIRLVIPHSVNQFCVINYIYVYIHPTD